MNPARMRGFSLLELAMVLVILGTVGILLVRWYGTSQAQKTVEYRRDILERADDALLAFASIQHRLPCPAVPTDSSGVADNDGMENCAQANGYGRLPWKTLGLPDAAAGQLAYGVLRRQNGADKRTDADLTRLLDRAHPIEVLGGGIATTTELGNVNGLDFCHALRVGMRQPLDSNQLHTRRHDDIPSSSGNIAYAIAATGPSGAADNINGRSPAFESPRRPTSGDYHEQVRAVGLDQLWSRLRCADAVATVTYAHFNVAAAAGIDAQAMIDYERQLEIRKLLATADLKSAEAGVAQAAAGLLAATGEITEITSEILKATANPEMFAADLVGKPVEMGFAVAALGAAIAAETKAVKFKNDAKSGLEDASGLYQEMRHPTTGLTAKSRKLADELLAQAKLADARGAQP